MDETEGPEANQTRQELLERYGIKPEEAAAWLGHLGYTEEYWDEVLDEDAGSHEIRGLVRMAQGEEPQLLEEAYAAERQRDIDNGIDPTLHPVYTEDLRAQTDMLHAWLRAAGGSTGHPME